MISFSKYVNERCGWPRVVEGNTRTWDDVYYFIFYCAREEAPVSFNGEQTVSNIRRTVSLWMFIVMWWGKITNDIPKFCMENFPF